MNFLDAAVRGENGALRLEAGPVRLEVPARHRPALAPYEGREIVIGVRPEHVHDPDYLSAGTLPAEVDTEVDIVELMGNETFLHLTAGPSRVLARVDPRTPARVGQSARVVFDLAHLHAFDPDTQASIALDDEGAAASRE